jgi:hypothetical protein
LATKVSKQQRKTANKKLKEMSMELTKLEGVLSEVFFGPTSFLFLVGRQNSPSLLPSSQFSSRLPNVFVTGEAMSCREVGHQSGES